MQKFLISFLIFFASIAYAEPNKTTRIPQFNNNKVAVWTTIVYPSQHQELTTHRHENDRVVVALNDGVLKVTNNLGKTHYLKLQKDQAYFLEKDTVNEVHTDENVGKFPIKVVVVELKS